MNEKVSLVHNFSIIIMPNGLVIIPHDNGDDVDRHHWLSYPSIQRPPVTEAVLPCMQKSILHVRLVLNVDGKTEERSVVPDVFCATAACGLHRVGEHVVGSGIPIDATPAITVSVLSSGPVSIIMWCIFRAVLSPCKLHL